MCENVDAISLVKFYRQPETGDFIEQSTLITKNVKKILGALEATGKRIILTHFLQETPKYNLILFANKKEVGHLTVVGNEVSAGKSWKRTLRDDADKMLDAELENNNANTTVSKFQA